MRRPAPYDLRLAARTLALAGVALSVVALVEWITDERGVASPGTGGSSIGLLPLVPIAGAIAVLVTLAPASASGELRALAALGVSPLRVRLAPIVAASLLAIVAGGALLALRIDVAPLFPTASVASDWRVETGDGGTWFTSERRHAAVGPDDRIVRSSEELPAGPTESLPRNARVAAAIAIAPADWKAATWSAP
jgi:hypothetical protein